MELNKNISLIIKVVFRKAVFNLGKNIKTFVDLTTNVEKRFTELQNYSITFKEQTVTSQNFQDIFNAQLHLGQSSIKLEINELPAQKALQIKPTKSKKFSFDPKEFEDDKETSTMKLQSKDSENEFQQLKISETEESEPSKAEQKEIDLDQIKIKVLMGDSLSNLKKQIGEEYKWSCNLINQNSIQVPKGVYIREISTNKLISLGGMGPKEAEQIEFGPFVEKEFGKVTRFFQIVYKKNEQTLQPIGNRFGFVVEASKKLSVKELESKVYKKINQMKSFSACEKSTEYIMARFKDMGIEDATISQYNDEDLIDMMESLNLKE